MFQYNNRMGNIFGSTVPSGAPIPVEGPERGEAFKRAMFQMNRDAQFKDALTQMKRAAAKKVPLMDEKARSFVADMRRERNEEAVKRLRERRKREEEERKVLAAASRKRAAGAFGKHTVSKKKKFAGYCIKKKRIVKVYRKGNRRYYTNNKLVPKGKRCFKTKANARRSRK